MDTPLQPIIENTFDGGLCDDTRFQAPNEFSIASHFDFYSKRNKLVPYRDMEDESGNPAAYNIGSVELFTDSGSTQNLFALGNVSGQTYGQILEKSGDMVTSGFATSTGGADTDGTVIASSLVGYRSQLYFLKTLSGNTVLMSYNPATNALATVGTITGTSASGVYPKMFRHPIDDILYIGVGNVIATLNNTTFTAAAFTLPSNLTITSFTDYGVFLAIACAPKDQGNRSWAFMWGRDTSITTVEETIDWDEGALMILENVGGVLVGIKAQTQETGDIFDIAPKLTFSYFSGGSPRVFKEIQWAGTGTPTTLLYNFKDKKDGYLYFVARQYIEGRTVFQLWVVGRNKRGQFFVSPDRLIDNDTAVTSVEGFNIIGDYLWVAYNANGSLKRTSDTATFTATSLWEKKYTMGDVRTTKETKGVSVMFEPLSSGQTLVLKYKKDSDSSYTTVSTITTSNQNSVVHRSSTTSVGGQWHEIAYRIESTGGATITGFRLQAEVVKNDVY